MYLLLIFIIIFMLLIMNNLMVAGDCPLLYVGWLKCLVYRDFVENLVWVRKIFYLPVKVTQSSRL